MARLGAWVQAGRPLAQIPILATILFGQALAHGIRGAFSARQLALVSTLAVLIGLLVVFANDAVDVGVDVANANANPFGGSSRVVPEHRIAPFSLIVAALVSLLGVGALAAYLSLVAWRPWMLVIASMTAHLTWMYGFPPFRLSYRGYGEVLQGVGTVLLVVIGYYGAASTLEGLRPALLVAPYLLGHATNVTTGLADTPADERAGKRTLSVRRGELSARRTVLVEIALAGVATPLALGVAARGTPENAVAVASALSAAVAGATVILGLRIASRADSSDPPLCRRFMVTAHAGIVASFLAWSLALFTA